MRRPHARPTRADTGERSANPTTIVAMPTGTLTLMGVDIGLPLHSRVAARLEDYARGYLPPEGRETWDRHVETCDKCNGALFVTVDRIVTEQSGDRSEPWDTGRGPVEQLSRKSVLFLDRQGGVSSNPHPHCPP